VGWQKLKTYEKTCTTKFTSPQAPPGDIESVGKFKGMFKIEQDIRETAKRGKITV